MSISQPESPLAPILRVLDWSFRIGRFFGTEVRVYGVPVIFLLVVAGSWSELYFAPPLHVALMVAFGLLSLYVTVWIHEMGHVLAGRRYHIRTPLITLSPLGGLAHMQGAAPNPRADIFIALCGPLTHVLALAVVWPLSVLVKAEAFSGISHQTEILPWVLARLVELNLGLLLFNLLPVWPLDGGRALRSLMALKIHPNRATLIAARIGMVGAVGIAVWAILGHAGVGRWVLLGLALNGFLACIQAVREARYSDGPYGEPREPWEQDPDAWKHGATWDEPEPRARPRAQAGVPREAPGEEELDRLLDRVREVGLAGLSDAERAALLRASEARRAGH